MDEDKSLPKHFDYDDIEGWKYAVGRALTIIDIMQGEVTGSEELEEYLSKELLALQSLIREPDDDMSVYEIEASMHSLAADGKIHVNSNGTFQMTQKGKDEVESMMAKNKKAPQ